jgi:integrase
VLYVHGLGSQPRGRTLAEVGARWVESGLLFTRPDGCPIHPDVITDWLKKLAVAAGLPEIRLHDVRHSYATAAPRRGPSAR